MILNFFKKIITVFIVKLSRLQKDESACIHLDCFVPNSGGQCLPIAPAAEGSSCGGGNVR